ncbi:sigma-B regulation protein RsbU (phosphoserine phosphatase) [Micromonospora pattaloongensis]|uniref:Sigma-B regulation protein RsbU (Phosphoserine phosphatase) n=1 Tax=Micromonospora pattaloongensis TaxID=405436 RepID=A0A1H3NYN3_9ACTN|nr:GAF domain-containing protein [Micromonospora pattaloongensis]SDY93279.1 sigma-B regulation protein RsbU (phosphoserine phosphatase) [Micromonospora pattaloongensis]
MSTDVVGEDRLAAVRRYEILDTPRDGAFDPVARIAATVFGTPIATVTIVDADRVWFAACEGLDGVSQIGVEPGLCASAVLQDGPYVVNDAAVDPRTIDHPLVRGALGLRFYAAAPITTRDGHRLGTVNVIDSEPREVTPAQAAVLSELAAVVMQQLELRLSAIRAVRAERELRAEADERAERAARLAEQMRVAAAAASAREHPSACELGGRRPCAKPAELKVADSWGDSAWACTAHAEEVILQVPSVFVADEALGGLAAYVRR